MKKFGLLVVAIVALVGLSAADPTVDESLYYSFTKTVSMEQGNPTIMARSGAFFQEGLTGSPSGDANWPADYPVIGGGAVEGALPGTYLYTAGLLEQYAVGGGTTDMADECLGTTHQTLKQSALASVHMEALDPEDENPELTVDMNKYQEITFSGPYDDYAAVFDDYGEVGTNFLCAIADEDGDSSETDPEGVSYCGNCWAVENSDAWGTITTNGEARLCEGKISEQSWTSLAADGWFGDVTMDGGIDVSSEFFGDTLVGPTDSVTTEVWGTTTHDWNFGAGPDVTFN